MQSIVAERMRPSGTLLSLALDLFQLVIGAGFAWYCLALARGEKPAWSSLFDGLGYFFKVVRLYILTSVLIALWSLLLVIPGVIAAYRYSMAIYIMRDHPEYGALRCVRESKALMRGRKAALFILHLSFLPWFLLGALATVFVGIDILSLWLNIYVGVSAAIFYIAATQAAPASVEAPPGGDAL
jgi:uncharacterized membrane protein